MLCRFKKMSNSLWAPINCIVVGCPWQDPMGCIGERTEDPWQKRGHAFPPPPKLLLGEDKAGLAAVWKRAACEWLLFNLYLVPCWSQSWDQSRKWKHMARVSRIRGPPHTRQREGKRQWELVWRNGLNKQSLRSPAPYYPIIYTAWELGNAGC